MNGISKRKPKIRRGHRPDISLVLPCYNESPVFAGSVAHITRVLEKSGLRWEIVFVDDASGDDTPARIKKTLRRNPAYRAVFHARNIGRGVAVSDGIKAARGTVVGYIDIDCEVSPVYIPDIVWMILEKKADMVIGRRIYRSSLPSLVREIVSVGYRWLSDALIGTSGLDTESGYKFFARERIIPILELCDAPHWFWDTQITVFARRAGLRVTEVPVLFVRRFDKTSSVRLWKDTMDYLGNLRRFRRKLALDSTGRIPVQ